ncbi:hypothetical protein Np060912_012 [Synechococcus phage S-RIM2]|uniref:Uncharacterized protein n=1 Tax=Synechococcus phage S-RIM2 TaxID=687800 RepID=A0A1D7RHW2_9CAUD|nr:hypothetical protein Np060912_012 [Synechococcus phage S-RIM2]
MAKLQVYKFVNPGTSGKETPATSAARTQTLALNRIGGTVSSIGTVISDIEKISIASIKDAKKREQFERRRERRQKDQSAEDSQELVKAGKDKGLQKKVGKKLKGLGLFGFLLDVLKPIGDLLIKIGAFALTTELLKYLGDPENQEKITTFFTKAKFVFDKLKEFGENIAGAIGTGLDFIFGKESTIEERLKSFGTIAAAIAGIGGIIAAAQGAAALLGGAEDLVDGSKGPSPDPDKPKKPKKPTKPAKPTPTNPSGIDAELEGPRGRLSASDVKQLYGDAAEKAYKKVLAERGEDAARVFLGELQESGGSVTKAQKRFNRYVSKGKFPKIDPPKPGLFTRFATGLGDAFGAGKNFLVKGLKGLPAWAGQQYNNLSKAAKVGWENTVKASQAIGEKGKNWANAAGDAFKGGLDKLGAGAKNFFLEKVLTPLKPIIDPIAGKAKQIGQGMFDMLMKIPGAEKATEVLKKKGINGFSDIATAGSKLGKRAAAILPVVGGLVNLAFAYDRAANGDSIGALIEGTSGVLDIAGLATAGAGNVASMLLDGYMFVRDFVPQLQQGEEGVVDAIGARGLKTDIDKVLSKLPNIGEIINTLMGKSNEEEIEDARQPMFLGGVVKGIGNAVKSVGKAVSGVMQSPVGQVLGTAASFIPGAAPIMAGINTLATGNPMSMLGMIPGMSGIMSGPIGNIAGSLMSGNIMGAATTGLSMLNPAIGQLAGSILGSGSFNPAGMVTNIANQFGMGGLMESMMGGDVASMAPTIARELGVDPKIVGGVETVTNKAFKEGGISAEYAMQTAMEFVPIPLILNKIVPMQVAVPINTGGGVVSATPTSMTERLQ